LPQEISGEVLIEKYAKGTERDVRDVRSRVARALASIEGRRQARLLGSALPRSPGKRLRPAGRINSAAGTDLCATLINCFVQPVGDSISEIVDGRPGIYTALLQAAETMRRGGGVGYDFSSIRPIGAHVKGTQSRASGPVSYMRVFDRSCETVESAGSPPRRADGRAALRPPGHRGIHPRQGCRRPDQLQHLGRRHRSLHAGGGSRRRHRTDASRHALADIKAAGAYQRGDGMWVYRKVRARDLWEQIMRSTYDHAEPGILFLDRMNKDNNLYYCETIEATNPCAEQPLPPYGCCCLGSINLTLFVKDAFSKKASFDFAAFGRVIDTSVRMLDNVLDATHWPLEQQHEGSAEQAPRRPRLHRPGRRADHAQAALRHQRRARHGDEDFRVHARPRLPVFGGTGQRARRLPAVQRRHVPLRRQLRLAPAAGNQGPDPQARPAQLAPAVDRAHRHHQPGLRRQCLNGIEPPFSWTYTRKKRMADGTFKEYAVEDYAWRLYKHQGGDVSKLPDYFVTALEISAQAHEEMVAAVAPYVDTSISKTVNVPADYPYAEFEDLYMVAWKSGLKGLATYRPNSVLGSVLSVAPSASETAQKQPQDVTIDHANRRLSIGALPAPVLASLRWPGRPRMTDGNAAWTYMIEAPHGEFALFVGQIENDMGRDVPFEVWVNGAEQPRGIGAVAKTLSMDMRANDKAWLKLKLDALAKTQDDDSFELPLPPNGERKLVPGVVSALAQVVRYRCEKLGALEGTEATPVHRLHVQPRRTQDRHRRHAVLDGGCGESGRRRRVRAGPEGNHPARRRHPPLLGVALRPLPARAGRPDAPALARHARARPGLDRHEAAQAAQLRRAAGRLHGPRARLQQAAELALDRRLHRAPDHAPLRHARHPRRERLPDPRNGHPRSPRAEERRRQGDAGLAVHRVRQLHGDPQGRLRFLHRLRRGGELRLTLTARKLEQVGHQRDDERLRYGLSLADRQRPVEVGVRRQCRRHEAMAFDLAHRRHDLRRKCRTPRPGDSARGIGGQLGNQLPAYSIEVGTRSSRRKDRQQRRGDQQVQ
jgi:ribonucleoside-diphosphate reductase alpha chain